MQGTEGWHPAAVGLFWNHNGPKFWSPTEWPSILPPVPTGEGASKANKKRKKKYIAYFYLVKTIESSMEIRQHPCRRFISVILIESPSIPWGMICSSIVGAGLALIKTHKPE